MRGWKCYIYSKIIHFYLLTWRDWHMKQPKDQSHNAQNRGSGEISICIFETYKNAGRPHGCHRYNTDTGMAMSTLCSCYSTHHVPPNWKCVLHCCNKSPIIVIPSQEKNKDTTNMFPTIRFHVYRNVSSCTVYDRYPYK